MLPVEAKITVTKVFITANMQNSKSHCKQEVDVPDRITLVDGENYMLVIPPLVERGLYCNHLVR
jgi:hypothetical protein